MKTLSLKIGDIKNKLLRKLYISQKIKYFLSLDLFFVDSKITEGRKYLRKIEHFLAFK